MSVADFQVVVAAALFMGEKEHQDFERIFTTRIYDRDVENDANHG
jgi:hypothetical protein